MIYSVFAETYEGGANGPTNFPNGKCEQNQITNRLH